MSAKKILIIDDEKVVLDVLRECLRGAGYHTVIADKGEYGIRCARKERPDLVMLDLAMPTMNGYEVMARIREERDVPIIMLTGHARLDDVLNRDDPPDSFIQKPVSQKQLLSTIEYLLRPNAGL